MPAITALLRTQNDELRLGRCLETLYPCDEIIVIDHGSTDRTLRITREYAARVINVEVSEISRASARSYAALASHSWILALDPYESLSEALACSLYELKSRQLDASAISAFNLFLREEDENGWIRNPTPQSRLVSSTWTQWDESLPRNDSSFPSLEGELLRFAFP
jgi:glycosyltransferase involved in cell wall biosynthesis